MKKKVSFVVVLILLLSVLSPSTAMVADAQENIEGKIESEIIENLESDLTVKSPRVTADVSEADNTINIEVTDKDKKATIEINGDISNLESLEENIIINVETKNNDVDYSISFSSIEDKNRMNEAIATDDQLLQSLSSEITNEKDVMGTVTDDELLENEFPEENTNYEIESPISVLQTERVIDDMPVIDTEEGLAESDIVLTNLETRKASSFLVEDGMPSAIPLIAGFAIAVGGSAAAALIKTGAAIIVGGALGFVVSSVKTKTKKKNYNHYAAVMSKGKLVAFKGLRYSLASSRLRLGGEVWSTSKSNALKVAKGASPLGKATSMELHRKKGTWRFHHFHPAIRKVNGKYTYRGTHSFFGTGVYG